MRGLKHKDGGRMLSALLSLLFHSTQDRLVQPLMLLPVGWALSHGSSIKKTHHGQSAYRQSEGSVFSIECPLPRQL